REMIDRSSLFVGRLNPKERVRSNAENLHGRRFLLHRHPENFLVKLCGALDVRDPQSDMTDTHGLKIGTVRSSTYAGSDESRESRSQLAAAQLAPLEIGNEFLD